MSENVVWQKRLTTEQDRIEANGQKGAVVWFTGLSGSGKSTVAALIEKQLVDAGHCAYLLDGDNLRHGLCGDLGFSDTDRDENIRRVSEVAALFEDAGVIALVSAISPFEKMRAFAKSRSKNFLLVYVKTSVGACEKRDPKGLYAKARRGEITGFTGIDSPYEIPESPDLVLDTETVSAAECAQQVLSSIKKII
ncbi:MAG TPA: adenylyl-sulfate kinase [Oscillospiraceae bacterium]|nr:adenylyl-sulfate kinase [Oscillospiraceae bacterium]HPF57021.1 adenylyl-sulfate kinase [Clostridiales bacterium]HPK36345.1 adenylyl-sulfate kinase [Oscillospiraceae bacterium]HPR76696.1 adenylyl-sulfate kinase [Oscillospiraceae bacterium]